MAIYLGYHEVLAAKMRKHIAVEKLLLSIAAVTRLPFEKVKEKAKGYDLSALKVVYKAACIDGKMLDLEAAAKYTLARRLAARETGRKLSEIPECPQVIHRGRS